MNEVVQLRIGREGDIQVAHRSGKAVFFVSRKYGVVIKPIYN
ncbi:MAG: hypothetical protein BWY69_01582 [Planctomycetes bacterium ADurb.Bin401]|nr:MAG: hypothetical protein BWY69_01582 [Planctomycetes bacterium ADurb.Bin401]